MSNLYIDFHKHLLFRMTVHKKHNEDLLGDRNLFSHHGSGMCNASQHHLPQNIVSMAVRLYSKQLTSSVTEFTLLGSELLLRGGHNISSRLNCTSIGCCNLDSCATTMHDNRKCVCMTLGGKKNFKSGWKIHIRTCQLWAGDDGMEAGGLICCVLFAVLLLGNIYHSSLFYTVKNVPICKTTLEDIYCNTILKLIFMSVLHQKRKKKLLLRLKIKV